jgi:hypothetical protein
LPIWEKRHTLTLLFTNPILKMLLVYLFLAFTLYEIAVRAFAPAKWMGSSKNMAFAKFTPGAIVSEIRGKIASTVFTKNKAGASIRNRVTPINRRSSNQTAVRQRLASLSAQWRGLTEAERTSWNAAGASFPQTDNLGQTIFLTGEQIFVRCNSNLILTGNSQITSAPTPTSFDVLSFTSLTVTADDGVVSLAFAPTVPAGYEMVVRATAPVSPGKSFISDSAFRFIKSIAPAATSPQALTSEYAAVHGSLTNSTDQKIFAEMYLVEQASGLAGIAVRGFGVVAAT